MMHSKYSARAISILVFLPIVLSGQRTQDNATQKLGGSAVLAAQSRGESCRWEGLAGTLTSRCSKPKHDALIFVAMTPCRVMDTRSCAIERQHDRHSTASSLVDWRITLAIRGYLQLAKRSWLKRLYSTSARRFPDDPTNVPWGPRSVLRPRNWPQ